MFCLKKNFPTKIIFVITEGFFRSITFQKDIVPDHEWCVSEMTGQACFKAVIEDRFDEGGTAVDRFIIDSFTNSPVDGL